MFKCTVCGALNNKDNLMCGDCMSTPRQRAIAFGVTKALRLHNHTIAECKMDKSREGIGISDWFYLASLLSFKFSYTNSFYHKYPFLDIANPPEYALNQFEFCTCSDVLEHVLPPVEKALAGIHALLKPSGCLIASPPMSE